MGSCRSSGAESPAGQVAEAEGDAGLREHRSMPPTAKTTTARPQGRVDKEEDAKRPC